MTSNNQGIQKTSKTHSEEEKQESSSATNTQSEKSSTINNDDIKEKYAKKKAHYLDKPYEPFDFTESLKTRYLHGFNFGDTTGMSDAIKKILGPPSDTQKLMMASMASRNPNIFHGMDLGFDQNEFFRYDEKTREKMIKDNKLPQYEPSMDPTAPENFEAFIAFKNAERNEELKICMMRQEEDRVNGQYADYDEEDYDDFVVDSDNDEEEENDDEEMVDDSVELSTIPFGTVDINEEVGNIMKDYAEDKDEDYLYVEEEEDDDDDSDNELSTVGLHHAQRYEEIKNLMKDYNEDEDDDYVAGTDNEDDDFDDEDDEEIDVHDSRND
ncbi:unnamed protein product [Ambrosiozyma monospora]|uniref:Unnamed protein product n=1 Tax=Ambrosiozyma monospora TaxID=43982 RepID=A0A9W7DDT5_AMBMO|nr:unnamed protein product [Ambrosiozyma monospora]